MRNPATLTAAALIVLVVGFVAGLMVGERRQGEERRQGPAGGGRTADPVPTRPEAVKSSTPATPDETVQLRERVRILEVELRSSRETSPVPAVSKGSEEVAERAYEDLLAIEKGGLDDPERLRSLFAALPQLDAATAKVFIDRYRKAGTEAGKQTERFVAVQLALMSGGPEAAEFLQTLLKDQSLELGLRNQVLGEVGAGNGLFSIRRLPVDESLGSTAMTFVRSEKPEERRAGAGLLGGVPTPGARLELERMLTQDSDLSVKMVAARSLGLVGDPSSRKLLEPYAADDKNAGLQKAATAAIKELDRGPR